MFLHGRGTNGKLTFLEILVAAFGDYAGKFRETPRFPLIISICSRQGEAIHIDGDRWIQIDLDQWELPCQVLYFCQL